MKRTITCFNLHQKFHLFLLGILFLSLAWNPANGQSAINSGLRFGESKLSVEEEARLQEYLENYSALTDLGNGYPPIWDNPAPQDKPHGIIVALESNPRINDIPLDQYDYIGGFYTDDNGELRCGGAGYWPDTAGIVFALQRDNPDTPEKDGFGFLETIYFKLFTFNTMKDYDVDVVEFDPEFYGTNKWGALGLSRLLDVQALEDMDFFIAPSGNPICIGDELTLSAEEFIGTSGNYSFLWSSDPPGFDYTVQFPPTVVPEQSTVYTLVVQDGVNISEHSLAIQVEEFPLAFAGDDGVVCANESFVVSGEAQNFSGVEWTTNGDGFFDDPSQLNTFYNLGPDDILNGQLNLTLHVIPLSPCDLQATDDLNVAILSLPDVDAGEDIVGCTTDDIVVDAFASDYSSVLWETSGSGTFVNANALTTTYLADGNDFQNGVSLTVCVEAQNPCVATACDVVEVEYVPGPTALGMTSSTGCENNFITVSGIAYNFSSTEWTTEGDGTFANPGFFTTQYYPGSQDKENGGTIVTLNAYPFGNCDTATKNVIVNVVNLPVISFGPNSGYFCGGDEYLQLDATVENSNNILWSTNGDGTFDSKYIPNAKYYPGPQDEQNGQFELELLAYPLPYCSLTTVEELLVIYQEDPSAFAGEDVEICEDETYALADADAEYFSEILWTGGNGQFSNPNVLNPVYTPSPLDFGTTVTLCLTASPVSPCDVVANDCMDLTIVRLPEADAGENAVICETDTYVLDGDVMEESAIVWTTSGDGDFSDAGVEDPVYTPGAQDIANGSVILTLTAQPNAPCTAVAEDAMQLDIQLLVTATAGADATICDIESHDLESASAANFGTLSWTTSGDGTFDDATAIQPTYFPGPLDIEAGTVDLTISTTAVAPCADDIIDTKTLTIIRTVEAVAGSDADICETNTWQLNGTVLYTNDFIWSTSGDGSFNNPNAQSPVYTPGAQDIANGSVILTLTAQPNAPCTAVAEDAMQLDIQLLVTASAGADATICDIESHDLESASAANFGTLSWTTSGDGVFDDPNSLNPEYSPGANDVANGTVVLTLEATSINPCVLVDADDMVITLVPSPEVSSGSDSEICSTDNYVPSDATADNYSSILWETSGDGTFSNDEIINPVYTPGFLDQMDGSVTLTITAQGIDPCSISTSDSHILSIQPQPEVDAGADDAICITGEVLLGDALVENSSAIEWETSGDGVFSDPSSQNPIYYPGTNDINNGFVVLTLSATGDTPCDVTVSDDLELDIQQEPTVDSGPDATICADGTHPINLASAENFGAVLWLTSGDGNFSESNELNTVYFPGPGDIETGIVDLTLLATGISPCFYPTFDSHQLTIQQLPEADAGADITACNEVSLNGFATNASSTIWTTNGDGAFDDPNSLNPKYTPGSNDVANGNVVLTLEATSINPCVLVDADDVVITLMPGPEVSSGSDSEICSTDNYVPSDAIADNYSSILWETSGDGTFSNDEIINPVYTPGFIDQMDGSVILTITAQGIDPCSFSTSDSHILSIQPQPEVDAGADDAICNTGEVLLGDALVDNSSAIEWETSGDGVFSDPSSQNPIYYPGTNDINNGFVVLTLSATGDTPCDVTVSDDLELDIQQEPTVDSGPDATICADGTHPINLASAENFGAVLWLTSGDGNFSESNELNTVYFPGPGDMETGMVDITVLATGISPCFYPTFDSHQLTIQQLPEADAGADITACGEVLLNGFATNASSTIWTTNGDGSFDDPADISAVYYPGSEDLAQGTVEINLAAAAISPCTVADEDMLLVTFDLPELILDNVNDTEIERGSTLAMSFWVFSLTGGQYHWYFNGELLPGQDSPTLTIDDMQPANVGEYQGVFTNNCGTIATNIGFVEVFETSTHEINIPAGWSGISSYVTPDDPDIESVFTGVVDEMIMMSNAQGMYWPAQNINTLNDFAVTAGYQIKMENNATLVVDGTIRYPLEELSIGAGWTYLAVNTNCQVNVADQFSSLQSIEMIKEIAGTHLYWPDLGINTLNELLPGRAYLILNNSPEPVTIKYPACDGGFKQSSLGSSVINPETPWNTLLATENSHIIGFSNGSLNDVQQGDILGAFNADGHCSGLMIVDKSNPGALAVFGDDAMTEIADGPANGDQIYFELYRPSTNEIFEVDLVLMNSNSEEVLYAANGMSVVQQLTLKSSTGISDLASQSVRIYPNPTTGILNISIDSPQSENIEVHLVNAGGQVIMAETLSTSQTTMNISNQPKGVYYLKVLAGEMVKVEKIVLK